MMTQKIMKLLVNHWKELILLLSILLIGVLLWWVHSLKVELDNKEKQESIVTLTPPEAEDVTSLRNKLDINKNNAELAKEEIVKAQYGLSAPVMTYKATGKDTDTIIKETTEKVLKNDSTLPKEALADTDKTVVVEQKDNLEVPVGIYKINTYKNWELGIGAGYQGNPYIPVSIQRNYDKNHSFMLEAHYDLKENKVNGGEVQWKYNF